MIGVKAILVFASLIAAGIGAVANAMWGPRAQARKRLDRGRTTTIVDREIVTLTGVVREAGELLEAPLSGKQCVLHRSFGYVYSASTNHNHRELIAQALEMKMIAFELETADGTVRVEGDQADLEIPPRPLIPRKIERERDFLLAHGQSAERIRFAGFEETVIVPGDKIRVQGMAIVELDPAATDERGYRDDAPRRIRVVAHEGHPLTIGSARR